MKQLMTRNVQESGVGFDVDGLGVVGEVDPVEDVELGCGRRNWSNVSPEGSLNFLPDSRKGVRQFNRLISIAPLITRPQI